MTEIIEILILSLKIPKFLLKFINQTKNKLKTQITNEYDELEEVDVPISLNFFLSDKNLSV